MKAICACNACALHGFGCCSRANQTATKLTRSGKESVPMCSVCAAWWAPVVGKGHPDLFSWMNAQRPLHSSGSAH